MSAPKTEQDALARAIEYLGAVEVAPGLYARCEAPRAVPWEIIPEAILREYTPERISRFGHRDRQFCGIISMPTWWAPERRFAWVVDRGPAARALEKERFQSFGAAFDAQKTYWMGNGWRSKFDKTHDIPPASPCAANIHRITASLDDGSEIPA